MWFRLDQSESHPSIATVIGPSCGCVKQGEPITILLQIILFVFEAEGEDLLVV